MAKPKSSNKTTIIIGLLLALFVLSTAFSALSKAELQGSEDSLQVQSNLTTPSLTMFDSCDTLTAGNWSVNFGQNTTPSLNTLDKVEGTASIQYAASDAWSGNLWDSGNWDFTNAPILACYIKVSRVGNGVTIGCWTGGSYYQIKTLEVSQANVWTYCTADFSTVNVPLNHIDILVFGWNGDIIMTGQTFQIDNIGRIGNTALTPVPTSTTPFSPSPTSTFTPTPQSTTPNNYTAPSPNLDKNTTTPSPTQNKHSTDTLSPNPITTPKETAASPQTFTFAHPAKGKQVSTLQPPETVTLCNFTTPQDTGEIIQLSIYLKGISEGSIVEAVIYSNDRANQFPNTLVARSQNSVNVTSQEGEWYNFTMNCLADQNTVYWLGYCSSSYTRYCCDADSSSVSLTCQAKGGLPQQLPGQCTFSPATVMSINAIYTHSDPKPTQTQIQPPTPNPKPIGSFLNAIPIPIIVGAESLILLAIKIYKRNKPQ